jgi:hypothetical protein
MCLAKLYSFSSSLVLNVLLHGCCGSVITLDSGDRSATRQSIFRLSFSSCLLPACLLEVICSCKGLEALQYLVCRRWLSIIVFDQVQLWQPVVVLNCCSASLLE